MARGRWGSRRAAGVPRGVLGRSVTRCICRHPRSVGHRPGGRVTSIALMALALPGTASAAASLSINAPKSAARGGSLSLKVSGMAPPKASPSGANWDSLDAWVQPGSCPAQDPVGAPRRAWGNEFATLPVGTAFSKTWSANSSRVALGPYFVCAWVTNDDGQTTARAQAPLTLRAPRLSVSALVPQHARMGTPSTLTVTSRIETRANVLIMLLPPRVRSQCPANINQAARLDTQSHENLTPFRGASLRPPHRVYHGQVKFRARVKPASAGLFHLCAYAQESPPTAPPPLSEAHDFTTFRVAR
jgi:hypothetical protein